MFNFLKKNPSQNQNGSSSTEEPKSSWLQRLSQGLTKTRQQFSSGIKQLFSGSVKIDAETLEILETH